MLLAGGSFVADSFVRRQYRFQSACLKLHRFTGALGTAFTLLLQPQSVCWQLKSPAERLGHGNVGRDSDDIHEGLHMLTIL